MTDPNVFPYYVQVSRASVEPVPPERRDTYEFLGSRLLDHRQVRVQQPRDSVYLTAEQTRTTPGQIWDLLKPPREPNGRPSLIIFDFASNPHHLLREILLHHIAEIATHWLRESGRCRIAILLPLLPPRSSLFWLIDNVEGGTESEDSRITVVTNDGNSTPNRLSKVDGHDYSSLQRPSTRDLKERLKSRVVRKVGHYDFSSRAEPHCARFFFEIEAAEQEIGELVRIWAEDQIRPHVPGGEFTLVSQGRESSRLHTAVAGAAAALGCKFSPLDPDGPPFRVDAIKGVAALVLDVVHTGGTYEVIVADMREQGITFAPEALAVMTTDRELPLTDGLPKLTSLCDSFERRKMHKDDCDQCQIGLPPTKPTEDGQIGLRTFDMWEILNKASFKREEFGPKRPRLPFIPDLGEIFDDHGAWIAYKIGDLLESLRIGPDVVFVCPREPHIERLVTQLGVLRQNRQLTVQIPRPVLDKTKLDQTLLTTVDDEWHRQLRHLGQRNYGNIVMLDEFVISYGTAKSIARLLQRREFGLEHRAYIPIVDFSAGDMPLPRTFPLYRLPHP